MPNLDETLKVYTNPVNNLPKSRILKNSREETIRKINEVIEKLRAGYSRKKCVEYLVDHYSLSKVQANKYVHDAFVDIFEASQTADHDELKEQYIDRIEDLLRNSLEKNNIQAAAKCLDMLNRINGMYIEKQEVNLKSDIIKFKFDS